MQIDVLLNDDGTLKATFFNRENSIRNFGEEIGYTQGAGLTYNVEFDTFKELVQIIFSGKNKKKDDDALKKEDETEEQSHSRFHKNQIKRRFKKQLKGLFRSLFDFFY